MMSSTYQPEAWQTLYIMMGGSVATLAGLLFVAMSLHTEAIMETPVLRLRAAGSTMGLVLVFTQAGVILIPQSVVALGIELTILGILSLMLPVNIAIRLIRAHMANRIPMRTPVFACIYLVGTIGGVLIAFNLTAGMYMVTAQCFATIALYFFNAWSTMIGISAKETVDRRSV